MAVYNVSVRCTFGQLFNIVLQMSSVRCTWLFRDKTQFIFKIGKFVLSLVGFLPAWHPAKLEQRKGHCILAGGQT